MPGARLGIGAHQGLCREAPGPSLGLVGEPPGPPAGRADSEQGPNARCLRWPCPQRSSLCRASLPHTPGGMDAAAHCLYTCPWKVASRLVSDQICGVGGVLPASLKQSCSLNCQDRSIVAHNSEGRGGPVQVFQECGQLVMSRNLPARFPVPGDSGPGSTHGSFQL